MNNAKNFNDDREAVLSAVGDSFPAPATVSAPAAPSPVGDMTEHFMSAVGENDATVERLSDENAIVGAAAAYLRSRELPLQLVCTPEWQHLNWRAAGINAEVRAPVGDDICGLTGVAAAAADCGAMLLRGDNSEQLTASLLPPHHLAVVRATDIFASLSDVLARHRPPGMIALSCGPSRTADIEQTLTLGVHGPLSVHVLILPAE